MTTKRESIYYGKASVEKTWICIKSTLWNRPKLSKMKEHEWKLACKCPAISKHRKAVWRAPKPSHQGDLIHLPEEDCPTDNLLSPVISSQSRVRKGICKERSRCPSICLLTRSLRMNLITMIAPPISRQWTQNKTSTLSKGNRSPQLAAKARARIGLPSRGTSKRGSSRKKAPRRCCSFPIL